SLTKKGKNLLSSGKKKIPITTFILLSLFLVFAFGAIVNDYFVNVPVQEDDPFLLANSDSSFYKADDLESINENQNNTNQTNTSN
ncbi:MAG: hypothetical protein PHU63_02520, partial [Candidatus ainarchaeum sp.]|nr:hypothetical protein [Candidatus ainarchaeum sp.]